MKNRLITLISTDSSGSCHGLRSISAYLRAHGHTTSIYYMRITRQSYSKRVLHNLVNRVSSSDLIGISCLSQNAEKATQVIESLKPLGIPIVWGGIHATLNPERCLEYADIVCVGEGEGAALDLVESLDDKDKIKTIRKLQRQLPILTGVLVFLFHLALIKFMFEKIIILFRPKNFLEKRGMSYMKIFILANIWISKKTN